MIMKLRLASTSSKLLVMTALAFAVQLSYAKTQAPGVTQKLYTKVLNQRLILHRPKIPLIQKRLR